MEEERINQYKLTYRMKKEMIEELDSLKYLNSTPERKIEILSNMLMKLLKRIE